MLEHRAEKPTVLVVDDEPMITTILAAILHNAGYPVLAAGGPGEALQIFRQCDGEIALAIVDYIMPEQNGVELACCLKEMRPGLRVLMMSGYTGSEIQTANARCKVDGFLAKPFKMETAVAAVQNALSAPCS